MLAILMAGALLYFLLPGVKQTIKESEEAEHKDWPEFLRVIAIVAVFVVLLIFMASQT